MRPSRRKLTDAAPRLEFRDRFSDELLDVPASELWRYLRGPSLFRLPGRHPEPLFVSVLLHGNEVTGWQALQGVLRRHRGSVLPRSLLLLVGNIQAAKANVRTLPGQEDYNRAWPGTPLADTPIAHLMRGVVDIVERARPFASIDIHNNTGQNPCYACVSSPAQSHLHLARLFSRTVVYSQRPLGVQSAAFAKVCPAVTIECGRPREPAGIARTVEFVSSLLEMQRLPDHSLTEGDLDLMRAFAILKIPPDATFSFDGSDADFRLRSDLDQLNFCELDRGTILGSLGKDARRRIEVLNVDNDPAQTAYLDYSTGDIRLARASIPAMLTLDHAAVRLDCLGYLMNLQRSVDVCF